MTRPWTLAAVALALAASLAGCSWWRPTVVPMAQTSYPAPCAPTAGPHPLLVLLPGRFMAPDAMVQHGFVDALRRRGIDADVLAVDAHLGYYLDRSILERLQADVVEPALRQGPRPVWIAGISLGAFGAMLYSESHPGDIAGVAALGPFLGDEGLATQIRSAGGLHAWQPPAALPPLDRHSSDDDGGRHLWRWLRAQAEAPASTLFLGFGDDDRYLAADSLLADAMPAGQVFTHAGGHDWDAWQPLWEEMLDHLPLPRRAACASGTAGASVAELRIIAPTRTADRVAGASR